MSNHGRKKNREVIENKEQLLYAQFREESDRGLVLLAGATLDILLRDLLAAFLVDDEHEVDALLGTEDNPDTPLGSFAARIKAAYCLGFLTGRRRNNLTLIRKIRNHFAHQLHGGSFEVDPVRGWCNALDLSEDEGQPESIRWRFLYAYIDLEVDLKSQTQEALEQRRTVLEEYHPE